MQICIDPPNPRYQGLGGSMQICIDPPNPRYQGLGGSMQICIDPPTLGIRAWGVDANLH